MKFKNSLTNKLLNYRFILNVDKFQIFFAKVHISLLQTSLLTKFR
jgi:hypothetical protein